MENKNIIASLLEVQKEIENPKNTKTGYHKNKYAPLDEILNLIRPILTKNNLIMIQDTGYDADGKIFVQTKLMHSSGECYECEKLGLSPDKNNAQGVGSVITYLRRYQLTTLLGICSEDDDDGESASGLKNKKANPTKKPEKNVNGDAKLKDFNLVDDPEARRWAEEIEEILNDKNITVNQIAISGRAKMMKHTEGEIKRILVQFEFKED